MHNLSCIYSVIILYLTCNYLVGILYLSCMYLVDTNMHRTCKHLGINKPTKLLFANSSHKKLGIYNVLTCGRHSNV